MLADTHPDEVVALVAAEEGDFGPPGCLVPMALISILPSRISGINCSKTRMTSSSPRMRSTEPSSVDMTMPSAENVQNSVTRSPETPIQQAKARVARFDKQSNFDTYINPLRITRGGMDSLALRGG